MDGATGTGIQSRKAGVNKGGTTRGEQLTDSSKREGEAFKIRTLISGNKMCNFNMMSALDKGVTVRQSPIKSSFVRVNITCSYWGRGYFYVASRCD